MKLKSIAFEHGGIIPKKYTCEGDNVNPPLQIMEVPSSAKSLVLVMEDPDVPSFVREDGMWDHWIRWNLLPQDQDIAENSVSQGKAGKGTSGRLTYDGPCPPDREHRYFFYVYALDCVLDLEEGCSKKDVIKAMEGHLIESTELMGRYEKECHKKKTEVKI